MSTVNDRLVKLLRNELKYNKKKACAFLGVDEFILASWANEEIEIPLQVQLDVYQKLEKLNGRWWFFGEGSVWGDKKEIDETPDSEPDLFSSTADVFYKEEQKRRSITERKNRVMKRLLEEKVNKISNLEVEIKALEE